CAFSCTSCCGGAAGCGCCGDFRTKYRPAKIVIRKSGVQVSASFNGRLIPVPGFGDLVFCDATGGGGSSACFAAAAAGTCEVTRCAPVSGGAATPVDSRREVTVRGPAEINVSAPPTYVAALITCESPPSRPSVL